MYGGGGQHNLPVAHIILHVQHVFLADSSFLHSLAHCLLPSLFALSLPEGLISGIPKIFTGPIAARACSCYEHQKSA